MATQRWTIAKIGGNAAKPVVAKFKRWQTRSRTIEKNNTLWTPAEVAQLGNFTKALHAHATKLPLIFFSEHIDMWSVGDSLFHHLPKASTYFVTAECSLACIALPLPAPHVRQLQNRLTRKNLRQEDRWFLTSLMNALHAWNKLVPDGAIIIVREPLGASISDEVVAAACKVIQRLKSEIRTRALPMEEV